MIAILATICFAAACREVTVTTSEQDPSVTLMACQMTAPAALAAWVRGCRVKHIISGAKHRRRSMDRKKRNISGVALRHWREGPGRVGSP